MPSIIVMPANSEPISLSAAANHLRVDNDADDLSIKMMIETARQDAETITRRQLMVAQWKLVLDAFPSPGFNTASANWSSYGNGPGPLTTARNDRSTGYEIYLPYPPLVSVDSIKFIDTDGVQQTLATSSYLVDPVAEPARITPAYGESWPFARNQAGAVEIVFTAGYAAPLIVDASTNTLAVSGPSIPLTEGAIARISSSGGELPGGLVEKMSYFVRNPSGATFQLSSTSSGAIIDLTDAGSETCFIGEVPGGIKSWMLLRIGSLFEYREENAPHAKVTALPFVDRLLDPFRVVSF